MEFSTLCYTAIIKVVYKSGSLGNFEKVLTLPSLEAVDTSEIFPNKENHVYLMEVPGMLRFTVHNIVVGRRRTIYFSQHASK